MCLLQVKTALRPQVPGGGEGATTNIKGQPISVCSMLISCNLGFILRVCDVKKKKEEDRVSDTTFTLSLTVDVSLQQTWQQHSPINGSPPSDTYNTSSSLSETQDTQTGVSWHDALTNTFIIVVVVVVVWAYLIRVMSSMRPPFPLYKQEALIPNLLLATDSKSDKVPYTATTWTEKITNQCVVEGLSLKQNGSLLSNARLMSLS